MRILLGSETYPPDVNGAALFTERLAIALSVGGHDVAVICPSSDGSSGLSIRNGISVHRIRSHRVPTRGGIRLCLAWEIAPEVARIVREFDPDTIHVQNHFGVGRALVRAARVRAVPVVATNHLLPGNLFDGVRLPVLLRRMTDAFFWADLARLYRQAQIVTAPTLSAVEALRSSAKIRGATAISGGVDLRLAQTPQLRIEPAVPVVLFVGRLDPEKRVSELIDAFESLPLPGRLEIVGDGVMRARLELQVRRARIESRVVFHGFVDSTSLFAAYSRCDVFCMPSIAELQSLATLEAMASGKPVVAAESPALLHLVRSGRNGFLYTSGNVPQLSSQLSRLMSDGPLRARMGRASAAIARSHEFQTTVDAYVDVYRDARTQALGLVRCASGALREEAARRPWVGRGPDAAGQATLTQAPRAG